MLLCLASFALKYSYQIYVIVFIFITMWYPLVGIYCHSLIHSILEEHLNILVWDSVEWNCYKYFNISSKVNLLGHNIHKCSALFNILYKDLM